jgi:hypothetical protein
MSTSKHSISRERVKQLTSHYKKNKNKILKDEFHDKASLPDCETFERAAFDQLLAQPGCVGVRIYFGMDEELNVKLIIVGVNEKNEDIRPASSNNKALAAASFDIGDDPVFALADAARCPPDCPPPPPPDPPTD